MSIYRMSTAGQHNAAISQILEQQVKLSKTQQQVSSGDRFSSPADDPVAATQVLGIERAQAQLDQYGKNAGVVSDRLSLGESAMSDLSTLLQRVRDLAVEAQSGALDDTSLKSIAAELQSRAADLQQIANRQDGSGQYLFAGYSTGTQPFASTSAGVSYLGDQGTRQLQISGSQKMSDGFNGEQVFMDVQEGNGTFTVTSGTHAGTGVIGTMQVTDAAQWNAAGAAAAAATPPMANSYTVRFTDPDADGTADSWELLDANGNAVMDNGTPPAAVTGTYTDGGVISFNGAQFTVSGQPAVGDTYSVQPAGTESLFKTVNDLIGALNAGGSTPAARAQLNTSINKALGQIDQGLDHAVDVRTQIGARLSALDTASTLRDDVGLTLASAKSKLKDVDYASAIATLNQQMVGLQAAQAAYTRIGQMSLFDYLR